MSDHLDTLRARAGVVRTRVRRAGRLRERPWGLRARVRELEAEVQENRQLHRRIAELTDVVAELLLPVADRDEEQVRRALADYRERL